MKLLSSFPNPRFSPKYEHMDPHETEKFLYSQNYQQYIGQPIAWEKNLPQFYFIQRDVKRIYKEVQILNTHAHTHTANQ